MLETVADRQTREALAASTPLWYWILCEAEKAGGEHLGQLGALIVGEVLIGLIETDPTLLPRRGARLGAGRARRARRASSRWPRSCASRSGGEPL